MVSICCRSLELKYFILVVLAAFFISENSLMAEHNAIQVDEAAHLWAEQELQTMTIDEKIGQLFMMSVWSEWNENKMREVYAEAATYHVGGVCFFAGTARRQIEITKRLNAQAKIPLLIGIDGEWGVGMRVTDAHKFPFAMNVGAVADSSLVYEMGRQIGQQCRRLGVHINFAPVHDLNSNPLNPVINFRSFGSGTANVSTKTQQYIAGMQSEGVLAVAKHFPGHGDTQTDSHHALPVIHKSREEFENNEFIPFRKAIENGLQALMIGHLNVPALDENDMPASLSPEIIQGIVKDELGFDGLIVSDALNMDAVAKGYPDHYLKAFMAGNDILLFPADVGEGVRQLKKGLMQGSITEHDIDERCRRVLAYKYALGVPKFTSISEENIEADLNPIASEVLNRQLLSQSITLVKNKQALVPIKELDKKKLALVSINNTNDVFASHCRLYAPLRVFNEHISRTQDLSPLLQKLGAYDEIIIGLHGYQKRQGVNYGISPKALDFISQLAETKTVHVVVMANPYAVRQLPKTTYDHLASLMFSYGNEDEIQRLSAEALFGGIACQGVLPLNLNAYLSEGLSLKTKKCRLGYTSVPQEVGLNAEKLKRIDTLIAEVIAEKMTPGCQILVAKDGQVAYHKAFGYHTYDKVRKVKETDIYDIASVTKIAATTPLVMQMTDEGALNLNTGIAQYLPELKKSKKGRITLKELLLHQSGLKSYIGFDFNLIDEEQMEQKLFHKGPTADYTIPLTPSIYMTRHYVIKEGYLSGVKTAHCSVKVADGVYTFPGYRQEMYQLMDDLELASDKKYRYSDLGFYYIMRVIEGQSKQRIDSLAYERIYAPMGMSRTCYQPLNHFWKENIVPTVDEQFFRKQLLQGYVHDQGAALLGGVAGHAGLFSNANDLAKLLQMYLNDGFYGGEKYFNPKTVAYFTQHTEKGYRRGLGFDKPEGNPERPQPTCAAAPLSTFGHTGFTGTGVWADPENNLIFIFLSNRVHPHTYNTKLMDEDIRPRIQQIVYDAIEQDF